jgi:curved DNA-binding protein
MPGAVSGDQFITLQIHAPPAQTEAQRKLYEQMAETFEWNPRRATV